MHDRILVAMSGGVDSSVTAALLKESGAAVEGVTMKLTSGLCCSIASAMAVCVHLGIPHRIIDLQEEFDRSVVRNFIDEYRSGRTPNPCIRCNDIIKFESLLAYAVAEGFTHLATGHYARIRRDGEGEGARCLLRKGADPAKDQSYFLYRLGSGQLSRVLFPLGGMTKSRVRRIAAERMLPAANRPESQEICFVPDNDYRTFLRDNAPDVLREGELVMTDGAVVGTHDGIAFYTVGQRRGLGVSSSGRLYVVRVEPGTNRVVLGQRRDLETTSFAVADARFTPFDRLDGQLTVDVKVRYRSTPFRATIRPQGERVIVELRQPAAGVTPGQAAVFYDGDIVVGGGIIEG